MKVVAGVVLWKDLDNLCLDSNLLLPASEIRNLNADGPRVDDVVMWARCRGKRSGVCWRFRRLRGREVFDEEKWIILIK